VVSLGVGVLGVLGVVVALVLVVAVTVLVAVVLGLLGLGSLAGVTVFGGLLVAAVVVFGFVLAVGFAAPATVSLALGRLGVRGQGHSLLGWLGVLALGCWWWSWSRPSRWPGAGWRPWWCWWGWERCC
jgi:hypothetical protein